jgi:hypothetical protein
MTTTGSRTKQPFGNHYPNSAGSRSIRARQLPHDTFSDLVTVGVLCVMEISFWVRVRYIAIRFRHPSMIQHHAFLILGRLSFIFGSVTIPSELLLTPAG